MWEGGRRAGGRVGCGMWDVEGRGGEVVGLWRCAEGGLGVFEGRLAAGAAFGGEVEVGEDVGGGEVGAAGFGGEFGGLIRGLGEGAAVGGVVAGGVLGPFEAGSEGGVFGAAVDGV